MSSSYFVDHKRGEVNELRAGLRDVRIKNKCDIIKKVIAYMSLGIDVSSLFSEMIMAASTSDPVQKKMVFQYLINYAREKSDLAILCISTFQKDCRDSNPMFRGLALRHLSALRVPSIIEYSLAIVRGSFQDPSPYVRRTAIMAVLKLRAFNKAELDEVAPDLRDSIYKLLQDHDCQVICNALLALREYAKDDIADSADGTSTGDSELSLEENDIFMLGAGSRSLSKTKGFQVDSETMIYLLSRLTEFSEWSQCYVLELASKYVPKDEEEMYDIMNFLESRLSNANSSVVLATVRVFLHLTSNTPEILEQVYQRLEAPLITLLCSCPIEVGYVVLCHINVIASLSANVFASSYKELYIRMNDILSVKKLKLTILSKIVTVDNATDIVDELTYYCYDTNVDIANTAIKAISDVAISASYCTEDCTNILLDLLDIDSDTLPQVIIECRNILRTHPDKFNIIVPQIYSLVEKSSLSEIARNVTSVSSTFSYNVAESGNSICNDTVCALVWMFGEFGSILPNSPYILESLVNVLTNAPNTDDTIDLSPQDRAIVAGSSAIQKELLTCCVKLFFKRPHEMRPALGKLLAYYNNEEYLETSNYDVSVHEHAILYIKLLQHNVSITNQVVNGVKTIATSFWENTLALHKRKDSESSSDAVVSYTVREFNTLSIVYGIPESAFRKCLMVEDGIEEEVNDEEEVAVKPSSSPVSNNANTQSGYMVEHTPVSTTSVTTSTTSTTSDDPDPSGLGLSITPEVTHEDYQMFWEVLNSTDILFSIEPAQAQKLNILEDVLNSVCIYVMASGAVDDGMKYYLYSVNANDLDTTDGNPAVYLMEVNVMTDGTIQGTLKTNTDEDRTNAYYNLFGMTMSNL